MAETIARAKVEDAEEILALQKLAYQSEAELYGDWSIPPLTQTLADLQGEFNDFIVLKAMEGDRIVGAVRARMEAGVCAVGRLVVHPQVQRRGIGSRLLQEIEKRFPEARSYELFTGSKSEANIRLYRRHGYGVTRTERLSPRVSFTFMEKPGRDRGK
ncbi:MAG: GNAT family N-acetyltransferase [Thermodesulfobacteriota bacterium]